jgi:hypothetical protein
MTTTDALGHAEGHGLAWTGLAGGLGQVRGVLGQIRPVGQFTFFQFQLLIKYSINS